MRVAAAVVLGVLLHAVPAAAQAPTPQVVQVGVFLRNVEAISLEHNAYSLNFVLWMKWKGELDPTKTLRFVNLLEAWALTAAPVYEEPQVLADGSRYQRLNVEGRFFHKLDLAAYPLDRQEVVLELEDARHPRSTLVYVLDPAGSGVADGLKVPGWNVGAPIADVSAAGYPGGLGQGAGTSDFSHVRFGVKLERPLRLMLFTMAPPVLLVLLCCFAVFFLRPVHVEARVGTVITALLTVVFLQLAFTDDVPWLGNSVLLDQLFNFSYLVMTAALVECVVVTRLFDRVRELEGALPALDDARRTGALVELQRRSSLIGRLDRTCARLFPPLYLVGCALLVLWGRA